jgi:hypothetical protein
MLACIPALPLACGGAAEEAAPAPDPVEVVALGLRFARLPAGFSVAENGSRLVLEGDGTMTVEAGERSDFGLDPVTDANAQQARFESLDGGEFLGVQKLIVPIGPAAYARGRFRRDGEAVEETTVFVVHPTANRMVRASYSYPAVEDAEASRQRVQQLFELVGEMETSGSGGTDEADAASDPSTEP